MALRPRSWITATALATVALVGPSCAKAPDAVGANEVPSNATHADRTAGSRPVGSGPPGSTPTGTDRGGMGLPADAAALAAAAKKTTDQRSAHFELVIAQQTPNGEVPTTTGAGDYDAGRSHVTMTLAGATGGADAGAAATPGFAGLLTGPVELITDGTTIYFKSALLGSLLGDPDTAWLSFSSADSTTTGFGGSLATVLPFGGAIGSASFLDSLKGAGDVQVVGPEAIDGVATTHDTATIDSTQTTAPGFSTFGGQTYREDVWIDGDGIVRRVSYVLDGNKVAASTGLGSFDGPLHVTFDLSAVGRPVEIALPPPDQVSSAGDIGNLSGLGGRSGFGGGG